MKSEQFICVFILQSVKKPSARGKRELPVFMFAAQLLSLDVESTEKDSGRGLLVKTNQQRKIQA